MKPKTPESKLKANAKFERKLTRKNVIFNKQDDADLLAAIESQNEAFNALAKRLLRQHFGLN